MLALFGYEDLNAINALKVVANLLANGIAFVIFIVDGQVVWRFCLAAMIAAAIGGYASASLARRVPQPVLRGARGRDRPGHGGVVLLEAVNSYLAFSCSVHRERAGSLAAAFSAPSG